MFTSSGDKALNQLATNVCKAAELYYQRSHGNDASYVISSNTRLYRNIERTLLTHAQNLCKDDEAKKIALAKLVDPNILGKAIIDALEEAKVSDHSIGYSDRISPTGIMSRTACMLLGGGFANPYNAKWWLYEPVAMAVNRWGKKQQTFSFSEHDITIKDSVTSVIDGQLEKAMARLDDKEQKPPPTSVALAETKGEKQGWGHSTPSGLLY